jgi:hypothetical protein
LEIRLKTGLAPIKTVILRLVSGYAGAFKGRIIA